MGGYQLPPSLCLAPGPSLTYILWDSRWTHPSSGQVGLPVSLGLPCTPVCESFSLYPCWMEEGSDGIFRKEPSLTWGTAPPSVNSSTPSWPLLSVEPDVRGLCLTADGRVCLWGPGLMGVSPTGYVSLCVCVWAGGSGGRSCS